MAMEPQQLTFAVGLAEHGLRLDKYLAGHVPELSRSQLQRLIQEGQVQGAHELLTARYRVRHGERITLNIPPPRPARPVAEALALQIVYEDDALLVINKPPGLVVHPAPGHATGTLVNALLFHCQDLSGIGGEERPGIVHRLDKDTSGLMLVAKHDRSHRLLAAQLKEHLIQRQYVALVRGRLPAQHGVVDAPIGRHPQQRQKMAVVERHGRAARTHYRVLEDWGGLSLLCLTLETGRTHQIRVHMAHSGHAVIGDPLYGAGALRLSGHPALERALQAFPRQALHAGRLRFQHPDTAAWLELSAPVPEDLEGLLTQVRQACALGS